MQAQGAKAQDESATRAASVATPAPGKPARAPLATRLLDLQCASGNRAVAGFVSSMMNVQRDGEKKTFGEVLDGDDPDALKAFRPFPPLSAVQLRKICRLVIDKNRWVGPDDEVTIESAWRAVAGDKQRLAEGDWKLWKECENYGAEIGLIPWMRDTRTTFADRVRASALSSVEKNVTAIRAEAARLGIAVDGSAQPQPSAEADQAVHEQRVLANDIKKAHAKQKELQTIPVGYQQPSWGSSLPPGGTPDIEPKKVANFNPEAEPFSRADPDPNPAAGIAKHEVVKAIHDDLTGVVAELLEKNPALYAMTARGGTATLIGDTVESARKQMAEALLHVLRNAAKTKADIEARALSFSEMLPVHKTVFGTDPAFKDAFSKSIANDYISEESGAEAAAGKLVSLLTIALIATVQVASGGAATPVVGAIISLAASAGTAAASWNDWAKLEAAAKSTVSDRNAIVTQEQADVAQLGALISTAVALIDVYGAGRAIGAASASAKAAVKALEGRIGDMGQLRKLGQGAVVENGRQLIERSVESMGPAATVRNVGNWQKIASLVSAESSSMGKLTHWRSQAFKAAEGAAAKAAAGREGEAARAALAVATGLEQVALGEALDAVIEVISGGGSEQMGHIGVGGSSLELTSTVESYVAAKHPVSRIVQRNMIEIVQVPLSELKLASMSPAEFESIIRQGAASGYFAQQGVPRMTVLDAKIHGGGHGYDGLGISKQGDLIQLYNLECKHIAGDSNHIPKLSATDFGTQGGLRWNEAKARYLLSAENPFAEDTRRMITNALKRRVGAFDERILEDTLAGALRRSRFFAFTPVWAKTEVLLAQMRGLASSGLPVGKLIRVAPRRR